MVNEDCINHSAFRKIGYFAERRKKIGDEKLRHRRVDWHGKCEIKDFGSRVFIRFPIPPIDPAGQLPVAGFPSSSPLERFALETEMKFYISRVRFSVILAEKKIYGPRSDVLKGVTNLKYPRATSRVANPRHRRVFRPALSRVQASGFVWADFFFNTPHERWEKGTSELCMRNK